MRRALAVCFFFLALGQFLFADSYTNPIIADGADPWVYRKDGFYYYTHTTGNNIRVRKVTRITGANGLGNASPVTVFTPPAPNNQAVWAPELHFVNGKWYVYYAADNGVNANHRMYVAEADTSDPQGSYTFKGKISDSTDRWAIDGTVLQMQDGQLYFLWSGWPGSTDGQQNIYIAPMSNPWTINGPRVLIATPTHGWEGWIQEGPQVIQRDGKIFVIYSANASWTDDYCLGMLVNTNGTVLNAASWRKISTPVFKRFSDLNGAVYGPGHCSFTTSLDGSEDIMFYHAAKFSGAGWNRNVRVQRFSWDLEGSPFFDVPIPTAVPLTVPSGEGTPRTPATSYTLAINAGPIAVRASPEQLSYKPGTVVTLTASEYAGIRFTGWTGDTWKTNHVIKVTMDRNKTAIANSTRPLVLMDNPNAVFTGTWTVSTNSTERLGADYQYAHTTNGTSHKARYTPTITVAGKYDVYALHSSGLNRSAAAPWLVSSLSGSETVYINQQFNGGAWLPLALERRFSTGSSGFAELSNGTGELLRVVIADGVAFLYSTNQDVAPIIYSHPLSQTVEPGDSVTLRVRTAGSADYQWRFHGEDLPGATNATLTISQFSAQHEGFYQVMASNVFGVALSSNALLTAASPLRFAGGVESSVGALTFRLIGSVGSNYVLEASENLSSWIPLETNLLINGYWDLTNSAGVAEGHRFFRARRW